MGIIRKEVKVVTTHLIDYQIDESLYDAGTEENIAKCIIRDTGLLDGTIYFESSRFCIEGVTESGKRIIAEQYGEFSMYGGPYLPKLKKPMINLDGVCIYDKVKKEFCEEEIELFRTDIWGHLLNLD